MAIVLNAPSNLAAEQVNGRHNDKLHNRFLAFADSQSKNKTMWFLVSMIVQGVFFLPVPAALMYFYNAPIIVLLVTLALFFANIISGMSGAGTRVLIRLFALSVAIHLVMVAIFVL